MVEGHSVHRVATRHRQRLVGKIFEASSPNGRFAEGAKAIHGKVFYRVEAVGKNLFAFFRDENDIDSDDESQAVVVHIHFGMAGNWAVYDANQDEIPEPTGTNRLRLRHAEVVADLSAMTVNHGDYSLYTTKKSKLGHDPLRDDADPNVLWLKVQSSKKSIGALIMDQSFFTGPGNIYRAEILFKAGVHPDIPGNQLERPEFDRIWHHTVALLQRGYQTGSILTVDPEEAKQLGNPKLRRYIYNTKACPRCSSRIKVWDIANRTCYACPTCQPLKRLAINDEQREATPSTKKDCVPFISHCAPDTAATRLAQGGPERLTVAELKAELFKLGVAKIAKGLRKAGLVKLLVETQATAIVVSNGVASSSSGSPTISTTVVSATVVSTTTPAADLPMVSSEAAAAEKAVANESLAVEHIAELAPAQARKARTMASTLVASSKETGRKRKTAPAATPNSKRRKQAKAIVTPSPAKSRRSPRLRK